MNSLIYNKKYLSNISTFYLFRLIKLNKNIKTRSINNQNNK